MDDLEFRLCLLRGFNAAVGTGLGDSTPLEGKPHSPFHSPVTHFTQELL